MAVSLLRCKAGEFVVQSLSPLSWWQYGKQPTLALSSARVSATPKVPLANFSNSNTPMGPFQMMVFASARALWKAFRESGPMSKPYSRHAQSADTNADVEL